MPPSAPLLYLLWLSCGTYHKPTFLLSKSHTGPEGLLSHITAIFVLPTLVQEEPQEVWDHTSADGHMTLGKVPMYVLHTWGICTETDTFLLCILNQYLNAIATTLLEGSLKAGSF